jgi:hypothetical protein
MSAQESREVDASAWVPEGGRARRCENCHSHVDPNWQRVGGLKACSECGYREGSLRSSATGERL